MLQIQKRNIVVAILLSLVTCGIYQIIWVIKMMKDAVKVKDENGDATAEILLGIFLPFIGFYLAEKKFAEGCQMRGIAHNDNSILYLILGLLGLGIVDFALLQNDLNKLVDMGYAFDPTTVQDQAQGQQQYYQAPQQPQYQQPQYQAPQQPQYQAPQQPQYQAPQQPQYQQPQYQAPEQQYYQAPDQQNPQQ